MRRRREYKLTNAVKRAEADVEDILRRRQVARYFEGIILMYSLIENVLKWLVYLKVVWSKCDSTISASELETLKEFCNNQGLYSTLNLAFATGLISHTLFRGINRMRSERNDIVHQLYLFTHRRNHRVLRAKLEKLMVLADGVFAVFNRLVEDTGMDDSYDVFIVRRGRAMLV
jgi:hypothetical protein